MKVKVLAFLFIISRILFSLVELSHLLLSFISFLFVIISYMNFYLKLRDLRKYFFLKVIVWLKFTMLILDIVFYLCASLPNKDDYSEYLDNIIDYNFCLLIFIFICFLLFLIEAFVSFIKRKYIVKKEPVHIPCHESKWLNVLDNIYTVFFIIMLLYAFLWPFLISFLAFFV